MPDEPQLTHPWLVAVWPGMGHVALNAGVYLLAKLGMTAVAEFEAPDLFDIDHVEVKDGLVQTVRRPRNRLFVWFDPRKQHDLVVFLGEAQPPIGKYPFCRQLMTYAKEYGVERVFTFAAMATRMHHTDRSRVFGAATDREGVEELKRLELDLLGEGNIGGLNGVLLGATAEAGVRGACLLGEMPHVLAQFPFPKASLAILEVFATITGIELDLSELAEQARVVDQQLDELIARAEAGEGGEGEEEDDEDGDGEPGGGEQPAEEEEAAAEAEAAKERRVGPSTRRRIEDLFAAVERDRSKAFELKRELDHLGLFREYEDRFLDLFKRPG